MGNLNGSRTAILGHLAELDELLAQVTTRILAATEG